MTTHEEEPTALLALEASAPAPAPQATPTDSPVTVAMNEMTQNLKRKLQKQQGKNLPSTKFRDLCPFPDAKVPQDFEVPKFNKYDGIGCPMDYLRAFCGELNTLTGNNGVLIRLFQKFLKGDALDWYTSLDYYRIKTWEQLSQAFIDRFVYNLNVTPKRADLAALRQMNDESLSTYIGRWQAMAARMKTPIDNEEQIYMIIHSAYPSISGYLISYQYANFTQLIRVRE
ncbi:uncharacterized protein LOC131238966 [Magnolia sinica]|uniref:uncharacterized protein LOC131238966 n=1 Tax=Magnolia sinica TaxID=86752 RepID=UPI0026598240|nr:uncharacterized protein LOC131238966 [Magnolia sinica]